MSKSSSKLVVAATVPVAVALPQIEQQWQRAKRYVESATLFQRASLAAQIMAGVELTALHKAWGVGRGGNRRSKPHSVALIPSWAEAVKTQLGISDQTAGRWMEMAAAAKKRLSKGDLDLGALLEKHPGALTPAEQELLKQAVHRISDGRTQLEFLLECGGVKPGQGIAVMRDGPQRSTTATTTDAPPPDSLRPEARIYAEFVEAVERAERVLLDDARWLEITPELGARVEPLLKRLLTQYHEKILRAKHEVA